MNRLIRSFLQGLHDRILASVASMISATFSVHRVTQHAQQMSEVEDLAREYESQGKTEIAQQLRCHLSTLQLDDPSSEARDVVRNVLDHQAHLAGPKADGANEVEESTQTSSTSRKSGSKGKRRSRKPTSPVEDMGISLDQSSS